MGSEKSKNCAGNESSGQIFRWLQRTGAQADLGAFFVLFFNNERGELSKMGPTTLLRPLVCELGAPEIFENSGSWARHRIPQSEKSKKVSSSRLGN